MKPHEQSALAYEIARTLNDMDSVDLHLSFTRQYPEFFLRKTLAKVMAIPKEKITSSRAAYYNYLVQEHGDKYRDDTRN